MKKTAFSSYVGSDAQYIIPFLSASCSALWEQGWLTESEANEFRISIKDLGYGKAEVKDSLVLELIKDKSPGLDLIQATCGIQSLQDALLRWTLVQLTSDICLKLRELTKDVIQKAELLFNQRFFLYQNDVSIKQTFFSFFLIDFSNQIFEASTALQECLVDLKQMSSSACWNSNSVRDFELKWSKHLGFTFNDKGCFRAQDLTSSLKKVVFHLEFINDRFKATSDQLKFNIKDAHLLNSLEIASEDWQTLTEKLRLTPLLSFDSWERMEHRRHSLINSFQSLKEILVTFHDAISTALRTTQIQKSEVLTSEADFREIVGSLLQKGVSSKEAYIAVERLKAYCKTHTVDPRHLLETELSRIHPSLDFEALVVLKSQSLDQHNSLSLQAEKTRVVCQKDYILRTLSSPLIILLSLALPTLTVLSVSCGVKTAPRSEVLDLRPALPYHANQHGVGVPEPEQKPAIPP